VDQVPVLRLASVQGATLGALAAPQVPPSRASQLPGAHFANLRSVGGATLASVAASSTVPAAGEGGRGYPAQPQVHYAGAGPPPAGRASIDGMHYDSWAGTTNSRGAAAAGTSADAMAGRTASHCSSVPSLPSAAQAEQGPAAALVRLQELLARPEQLAVDLGALTVAANGEHDVPLERDVAVHVLVGALQKQLFDLRSIRIDKSKWQSLLKRFGLYGPEDKLSFDALVQLYCQTLGALRDCFAPQEFLRSMRRVSRCRPKLKDKYDSFQFQAKDSLGKVYRCRDCLTKEQRCCRQIRKDKASAPMDTLRQCLVRLQDLEHPRIPRVVEHLEDFHNFYVISEPPEGNELMDVIQESYAQSSGLNEAWVSGVLRQVLEAMAYCHSRPLGPVVHRDLRPGSILLSGGHAHGGQPCVSVEGFGLQVLFDLPGFSSVMQLESGPACCLPEFLAPEVWRQDFGPRCDIWSCGCLLFLLLAGVPPFGPRLSVADLAQAVATGEPDWRLFRHASTSALSLCRRMLAKDDAERPTAVECLQHPWFAGPGATDRVPKELRPESVGSLMQFHAQSKFLQVLMNVVATEMQVASVRRVRPCFAQLDADGSGYLGHEQLCDGLTGLGVSARTADQIFQVLGARASGKAAYTHFLAGCIDLIDDKLDHMLWKVFAMVDEEHSGEMSPLVFAHFLEAVCHDGGGDSSGGGNGLGDVERYLRSVLEPGLSAAEVVSLILGSRDVVTFEEAKAFLLEGAGGAGTGAGGESEDSEEDSVVEPELHTPSLAQRPCEEGAAAQARKATPDAGGHVKSP